MIYKITLSISGDNFFPSKCIDNILGESLITSSFSPNDKKIEDSEDLYNYGGISIWHPKKAAMEKNVYKYESFFVEFLEKNYKLFIENGAKDFDIYIEIFYDGEQCNFEIFNNKLLNKLTTFNVSIPISVYRLKKKKYKEWLNEIELEWNILEE